MAKAERTNPETMAARAACAVRPIVIDVPASITLGVRRDAATTITQAAAARTGRVATQRSGGSDLPLSHPSFHRGNVRVSTLQYWSE